MEQKIATMSAVNILIVNETTEDPFMLTNKEIQILRQNPKLTNKFADKLRNTEPKSGYYLTQINDKKRKEFDLFHHICERCGYKGSKAKLKSYAKVTMDPEWRNDFAKFFVWLQIQPEYKKWQKNENDFEIDKDISGKNRYSPETCFLIPAKLNGIFVKHNKKNGDKGYYVDNGYFRAAVSDSYHILTRVAKVSKRCSNEEEALNCAKQFKKAIILGAAKTEFEAQNISRRCYDAIKNYAERI